MIGGLLNTGCVADFGFGDFENETIAGIQVGLQFGYKMPSIIGLQHINTFIRALKAASSVGSLSTYADINIYCTDIAEFPFGWDGIKWNDPNLPMAIPMNGIRKIKGRGWSTNGTNGFIDRNYVPANETITATDDVFHAVWYNNLNSANDHITGANGFWFKTGTSNHGWQLYRGINSGSLKAGLLRFYAETNASQSFFYDQNELGGQTNVTIITAKPTNSIYSLARNNNGIAQDFLDPRSIEHVAIVGKRSEINRTTLYNAIETFVANMLTLRD